MARIDLNIVDRGIQGTDWKTEDTGLTADHLDKVMEQKTDNSGALNSLPTPFARFFVAREAFRRVKEEHIDSTKEAGFAYRQLVSDILDVYELLFNSKYHEDNTWKMGEKLEVREWDSQKGLAGIKKSMPILYNSIDTYFKTDINEDKLYFLVFTENGKDKLLACSSPYTGFVTPPDMDKSQRKEKGTISMIHEGEQYRDLYIRRKSGGWYFRDIKMFEDRDPDFKNYLYNNLFSSANIDDRLSTIKEYIRSFANDKDIQANYQIATVPVNTDFNDPLVINGLNIMRNDEVDLQCFFTPNLIKVPYRISRNHFAAVTYENDVKGRDYDYLAPIKPEIISLFDGTLPDVSLHINRNSVTANLTYKGKTYAKEYAPDPLGVEMGKIVDLKVANISFDLGLFPNILSPKAVENNYFKVLVVAADEDPEAPNFDIDKISLSFFKNDSNGLVPINETDPSSEGTLFGVMPAVVRSRQKTDQAESGTKFYELFGTHFDVVEVEINGDTGLLFPIWNKSQTTTDEYTYAVDLGTSNTFISSCKKGTNNSPVMFSMGQPMVSYLHEAIENPQISEVNRIEDSIFDKAKDKIKTEFLPALIDGTSYKFPIRTALCGILSSANDPQLFDSHNIAFFYEKRMANDDQLIHTDIKWEKKDAFLRIFIRELLLIIKSDILQRNGDLSKTHLVWFRPLSFMGNVKATYEEIWKEEAGRILTIKPNQINCYSESEAPYYFFMKRNYIKDSDAVSVIDIGGGSTDFVYFKDNNPVMANSVHFGCDVLWENGFIEFENQKENGIYKHCENAIKFKRADLEELNTSFKMDRNTKTKDIINFWLSNAANCEIRKLLRENFKPVFVYHLTSILYYMASMYKGYGCEAPKTIVFSGNGSKYIDDYICSDKTVLEEIINLVFAQVFGGTHKVHLTLPEERKESTCYGGLYRAADAASVPEKVYHGDLSKNYEKISDIDEHFKELQAALVTKYSELSGLYKRILKLLKDNGILDKTADTSKYEQKAIEDMAVPLSTYYKAQVKQKYPNGEVILTDSVFFLPIIDRIFNLTKE